MFSAFEFNITNVVSWADWRDGANMLMVKLDPPPKNYRNCGGTKVNFSGDYFSGLVPFCIWRPVRIDATVQNKTINDGSGNAQVALTLDIVNHAESSQKVNVKVL